MKFLFVHQTIPGQFKYLARYLASKQGNEVLFITEPRSATLAGVRKIEYRPRLRPSRSTHKYLTGLQNGIIRGQEVGRITLRLRKQGFMPDLIYAHPGWGESLYLKDVYPEFLILNYFEFYYHAFCADTFFDPEEPIVLNDVLRIRTKNAINLLSLEACDWGVTPTKWQWQQHPAEFRYKISIIHDGVNTHVVKPDPDARFTLPTGLTLSARDEVVTYVSRNLEPYRGFPSFLRAASEISRRRPQCHILIVGGDGGGYGRQPPKGKTWRELLLQETSADTNRIHFLGHVRYKDYLRILQISSAHVYLTVPFVLSWSMLEAMSAGCVLIGSNTPPVAEVIKHGENGLLVDFFSSEGIADTVEEVLSDREHFSALRTRARETVLNRYSLETCLPKQLRLMEDLMNGRLLGTTLGRRPTMP